ncbi:MAG: hypothetical protein JXR59_05485 [Desulfuromonadaceae bacterium]|nr:hypothetical protein [Desulfuromonadaceae bacterium]
MFKIVQKSVDLRFPRGHHLHCLIAQIPNEIRHELEPDSQIVSARKWQRIRSVLELVSHAQGNLKKLHFLLVPESTLPLEQLDDMLALVSRSFAPNTVTMIGIEHMPLTRFVELVERFQSDNQELLVSIRDDRLSGNIDRLKVNSAAVVIKEDSGTLRVFLQAKSHPFAGEEALDACHDLYHGKVFPLWHCQSTGFNFMALICFDYIYRTLYQSNIAQVIHHANELYFSTRQHLDLLAVLECNPKPEHPVFRDVVHGFYGELLEAAPGVRETITVFCNAATETRQSLPVADDAAVFGHSSVIIHKNHRMLPRQLQEFSVDDFDGLPVCRLRFGNATRLFYFNLPVFHEFDPRTTRMPLKVHRIYRPDEQGSWISAEQESDSRNLLAFDNEGEQP